MGGRDHACEGCGRGGFNDPDGVCECPDPPDKQELWTDECDPMVGDLGTKPSAEQEGERWTIRMLESGEMLLDGPTTDDEEVVPASTLAACREQAKQTADGREHYRQRAVKAVAERDQALAELSEWESGKRRSNNEHKLRVERDEALAALRELVEEAQRFREQVWDLVHGIDPDAGRREFFNKDAGPYIDAALFKARALLPKESE